CALVRPGLAVESSTILDRMLDPSVKLGTSTPRADPAGDYAWEVFRKADRLRPGAFAALEGKALRLTGVANAPVAPLGRTIYGALVAEGKADIFLTYCTNAREAQAQNSGQQVVPLPAELRSAPITDSPWLAAPRHRPTNSPSLLYRSTDSAFWQSMGSLRRRCRDRSRATLPNSRSLFRPSTSTCSIRQLNALLSRNAAGVGEQS